MNPLQKKCVYATAGFHLLLVAILFLGPGFFHQEPKPDDLQILHAVSLTAIEAATTSGSSHNAPPPAVHPPTPEPPPPTPTVTAPPPTPEPPKPIVTPPIEPKPIEPKPPEPTVTDDKPTVEPTPPPKPERQIEVDLTPVVPKTQHKKPHVDTSQTDAEAEAAAQAKADAKAARRRADAYRRAAASIDHNLTSETEVSTPMSGENSHDTVNYGQFVKSVYYNAWILPSSDSKEAAPKVRVVIARDGSVVTAHIIQRSGDAAIDDSVQRVLDQIHFIRPFAADASENERTFVIKFDSQTKQSSDE